MLSSVDSLQPWLFQVVSYPEESFGHYLGRFRRANHLSSRHLSILLGLRPYIVSYWETPSRRRIPQHSELNILSYFTGVDVSQLRKMLDPVNTPIYFQTRLCEWCYTEAPFHRLTWQRLAIPQCDRHQRQLLSACPRCRNAFRLPVYWQIGQCEYCYLPFKEMASYQQASNVT